MEYWIDGCNIVNRAGWTRTASMEQARNRLVTAAMALDAPVRIWFDASKAPALPPETPRSTRVRVTFVRKQTADDAMTHALRELDEAAKQVTFVTDDRELRGRAHQLGARTLGVEKFIEAVTTANAPPAPRRDAVHDAPRRTSSDDDAPMNDGRPERESKAGAAEWMRLMGFTDPEPPDLDAPKPPRR